MRSKWSLFIVLVLVVSAVLVACGTPTTVEVTRVVTEVVPGEEVVKEVTVVVPEEVTVVVEAPTPAPVPVDRNGAWLDTVVVVEEPNADAGVSRLEAGDIDVYAFAISSPAVAQRIRETDLKTATSYGSFNEITFNPTVFTNGKLNPFIDPKIREAMNWLVDRDYIVQEIMGGLGVPKYVPIGAASSDRAALAAEIRQIEAKYAYNKDAATEIIKTQMEALGATMVDGKWTFNGEPVTLIGLIRTEDERRQIGDYVSNELESIGFTVDRQYKTSAEASPIWLRGEPTDGLFHFYTGGWVSTAISRDDGGNFLFYYTPSGLPRPLWQAYTPTPELADLAQRLNDNNFTTLDERKDLFAQALPLAAEDSVRIWLLDRTSVAPYRPEVSVSADLSGSIYGSALWPFTARLNDQLGGSMTWAMPSILTEAWNPIAGSNWIYDQALIRATQDAAVYPDPATGLNWPQRLEKAEVFVKEGLPVGSTLDWVKLEFVPEITVPEDAWVNWDATNQVFLTASEYYTAGIPVTATVANVKVVSYYPADIFDTVKWHDGSNFSMGDMIMFWILQFDQAKPESLIYDEAQVPAFESFMATFKGLRIVSTNPPVIEYYTDQFGLDAENTVSSARALWPNYNQGTGAWHNLGIGVMAEEKGLAAFSPDKAAAKEIETVNYISGPTVEILNGQLISATAESKIPYAPTMSLYVTPAEATTRYQNLTEFFRRRGHFWIGTGPFFLQRAFPVEGTVILERNPDFPDASDKWSRFSEPAIATVEIDGPGQVTIGQEAVYDIFVTFQENPYALGDIQAVTYLVFDATGALAATGTAEGVADGQWQVKLASDVTSKLAAGADRLEIVVASKLVALPSLATYQFVTVP